MGTVSASRAKRIFRRVFEFIAWDYIPGMRVRLCKLFQIDRHERKRFVYEFFEGRAFFHVAIMGGESVNCPSSNCGGDIGGNFSARLFQPMR